MEAACANPRCDQHPVQVHPNESYFSYYGPVDTRGVGQIVSMRRYLYKGGVNNPFVRFHLCETCHTAVEMIK